MFKKFVFYTGVYDFLLGLFVMVPPLLKPAPGVFVMTSMVGAFLVFSAAVLMWASEDIAVRGPTIVWQGLVRVFAVVILAWGIPAGLAGKDTIPMAVIDAIVAPIYFIGVTRVIGIPFFRILLGKNS